MGKKPDESMDFVDRFLTTGIATPADIDSLIQSRTRESEQLEYKGGDWLKGIGVAERGKPAKPGQRLLAWCTSFANSAGGVLLVGIDESDAVPCRVNGSTCSDWATDPDKLRGKTLDALRPLTSRLSVPPRVEVVDHPEGMVLAIGVERAPDLIPFNQSGWGPIYLVRSFDSTIALADVVAADLVLGRRARPTLELRAHLDYRSPTAMAQGSLQLMMTVENLGLVWADDVRVGLAYALSSGASVFRSTPQGVLRAVDVAPAVEVAHVVFAFPEQMSGLAEVPPMAAVNTDWCNIVVRADGQSFALAAFVVSKGHPPLWWQITGGFGAEWQRVVNCEPCGPTRPRIA
jgi:hypothetical protein